VTTADPTYAVGVIEHIVIPTRDGRELSALVWKPVTSQRLPVVLEYIPYRKRDFTRARDEPMRLFRAARLRRGASGHGRFRGLPWRHARRVRAAGAG
jgi:predicted acyl esterase